MPSTMVDPRSGGLDVAAHIALLMCKSNLHSSNDMGCKSGGLRMRQRVEQRAQILCDCFGHCLAPFWLQGAAPTCGTSL